MFRDHAVLILALTIFLASLVTMGFKRVLISPMGFALGALSACSILVLHPLLASSNMRDYVLSSLAQWYIVAIAVLFLIPAFMMTRPRPLEHSQVRWYFFSQRVWLFLLAMVCLADPVISILLFGKVGIAQANEGMGAGGGTQAEVSTPLTFMAWSCGLIANAIVQTDFFSSGLTWSQYLFTKRKYIDVAALVGCLLCNSLTGNRFIMMCSVIGLGCCLAMFGRLKIVPAIVGIVLLATFFTIVGNFRFGRVEIKELLAVQSGNPAIDSAVGWFASYLEPIFPTLDVYLRNAPGAGYGRYWLGSVVPSGILDGLGVERMTPSMLVNESGLLPHHGLTFRTMFAEYLFDFGLFGSLAVGGTLIYIWTRIFNRCTRSSRSFLMFVITTPMVIFIPFIASVYSLSPLAALGVLAILAPDRTSMSDV